MPCTADRLRRVAVLGLALVGSAGSTAEGLQAPEAALLWPSWQARITLTLTDPTPANSSRSLRQAAVLGDYYLHSHGGAASARWRGGFRATSGVVLGHLGAAVLPGGPATALSVVPGDDAVNGRDLGRDNDLWPYIGLGYTGLAVRGGWGFSADVGLGLRGWEGALRAVDLTPMLQLGVRYSF
jgi:hypothetical protein